MNRRHLLATLAVLCGLGFGAGLLRLFLWRFEVGDVYPPYSSLRTDPLGSRALHDALGTLPALTTSRFFLPTSDLPDGRETCLLLLGSSPTLAGSAAERADLDRFLATGGRLVLALDLRHAEKPATRSARRPDPEPAADDAEAPDADADEPPAATSPAVTPPRSRPNRPPQPSATPAMGRLLRHWDVGTVAAVTPSRDAAPATATLCGSGTALPATLSWPAAGALDLRTPQWTAVYRVGTRAVVAQRRFGDGTLIVLADSYCFSNEGLREALQPEFLSWLVGPSRHVLFDETHLGIQSRFGVMTLARRYRLQWFLAALAGLAGLYLWHSLARPQGAAAPTPGADAPTGRAAPGALRDLLRQHLPREALLQHCVEAWGRSSTLPAALRQRRLERLHACLRAYAATPRRRRDAVACYRELCALSARKD